MYVAGQTFGILPDQTSLRGGIVMYSCLSLELMTIKKRITPFCLQTILQRLKKKEQRIANGIQDSKQQR
jgi:hypothetical protein